MKNRGRWTWLEAFELFFFCFLLTSTGEWISKNMMKSYRERGSLWCSPLVRDKHSPDFILRRTEIGVLIHLWIRWINLWLKPKAKRAWLIKFHSRRSKAFNMSKLRPTKLFLHFFLLHRVKNFLGDDNFILDLSAKHESKLIRRYDGIQEHFKSSSENLWN